MTVKSEDIIADAEQQQFLEKAQNRVDIAKQFAGDDASPRVLWAVLHYQFLSPSMPFEVHRLAHQLVFQNCDIKPAWIPSREHKVESNIWQLLQEKKLESYEQLYEWSIQSPDEFVMDFVERRTKIVWDTKPNKAFYYEDADQNADHQTGIPTVYFPDGKLNITKSCFAGIAGDAATAIVYANEAAPRTLHKWSKQHLQNITNMVSNAIVNMSIPPSSAIAICMPMIPESVAIYLGIVQAGCSVVSIADSFSSEQIATRCQLANVKMIFTQDVIDRGNGKMLPLFPRVLQAQEVHEMPIIVVPASLHQNEEAIADGEDVGTNLHISPSLHESVTPLLRPNLDQAWHDFVQGASSEFEPIICSAMTPCNILFSSGTTGDPKAIVWSHSTPIKCAMDGYYHQDVHAGDIVAWPTNIGWMMGPWLIYQLMNGATLALFNGTTSTDKFCQFIDEAKVTMLGVIPSLVKAWQANNCTADCNWSSVTRFSSTGEASDATNYLWLMSRVSGYAPVMEYCGGTEIGGSFLSSTMMQPNVPSMFSTPVLGSRLWLLDENSKAIPESAYIISDADRAELCKQEDGKVGTSQVGAATTYGGEIALVPPSIGLSTELLNKNHYDTYYKDMPQGPSGESLRRHGDEVQLVRAHDPAWGTYYRALGRCDDTMNIGGIKVGSVEIERACNMLDEIQESAAIAVSHNAGPCKLVVYVVLEEANTGDGSAGEIDQAALQKRMQQSIKLHLNPLFGISDIVITKSLPRTASNKVMRRLLRDKYVG